jgi:GWxTD domain-containing protein
MPGEALTAWSIEECLALIAHEMAHVARHDFLVNLLQNIAESVLFYHPAVWWISAQIRAEREVCCDDLAVLTSDAHSYAEALLALESRRPSALKHVLAADGGSLTNRIRRLIDPVNSREKNFPAPAAAWAMTFLWLAGIGVAALHASQSQPLSRPRVQAPAVTSASPAPKRDPWPAVRNTLLYDPILSAQVAQNRTPPTSAGTPANKIQDQWTAWLNEDVVYIITDEERAAFRELRADADREQFIEQFRQRRNASSTWSNANATYAITDLDRGAPRAANGDGAPDLSFYTVPENQRKAFAELHTDAERKQFVEQFRMRRDPAAGAIENQFKQEHYRRIAYANEHFASNVPGWKTDRGRIYILYGPPNEIDSHPSAGIASPFEDWRYRYIQGVGLNVMLEFIDSERNGNYRMQPNPLLQNHPIQPIAGSPAGNDAPGHIVLMSLKNFDTVAQEIGALPGYETLPMRVGIHFLRITSATVATSVNVQFENAGAKPTVEILMRVSTMTRRPVFSSQRRNTASGDVYQETIPLPPGRYRLEILAKESSQGRANRYEGALDVPHFEEEHLDASSLILADVLEKLPA